MLLSVLHLCSFCQISEHLPFSLYEVDWNLFSPHTQAAVNLIPAVANAGIKSTVCGPGELAAQQMICILESEREREIEMGKGERG